MSESLLPMIQLTSGSTPMFKKRIRKWSLSRNMKADAKAKLVAEHLRQACAAPGDGIKGHLAAKIARYARDQTRQGKLNGRALDSILSACRRSNPTSCQHPSDFLTGEGQHPDRPQILHNSIKLPAELRDTDVLLRSLQRYSTLLSTGSISETVMLDGGIDDILTDGLCAWKMHDTRLAGEKFNNAAILLLRLLH